MIISGQVMLWRRQLWLVCNC